MSQFSLFILLTVFIALSLSLLLISRRLRLQSGLPQGEVIYSDTSTKTCEVLISQRYGLSGKPDYLLRDRVKSIVPVEVKSGPAPHNGQPYESHLMQLAVYFLLLEDVLHCRPPYGLIRYRDRSLRVENTDDLREDLLSVIEEMRETIARDHAQRSHNQSKRCARCSLADACDQRLVSPQE